MAKATATYQDIYAGAVPVRLVPMPSDRSRFWWKGSDGQVYGGQVHAFNLGRAVRFAQHHAKFSNVEVAA